MSVDRCVSLRRLFEINKIHACLSSLSQFISILLLLMMCLVFDSLFAQYFDLNSLYRSGIIYFWSEYLSFTLAFAHSRYLSLSQLFVLARFSYHSRFVALVPFLIFPCVNFQFTVHYIQLYQSKKRTHMKQNKKC